MTWTDKDISNRFAEAISTLKKLPPAKVEGYFNIWPTVIHSFYERMLQEPQPLRILATPDAISRLDETLHWLHWVEVEERKLIWYRAARIPWRFICRELGCNRSTAWRKWVFALCKIAHRLNEEN